MSLESYPKYRDSGVEWLGEVPELWEVKPLKYLASINDKTLPETTEPDFELEYVDIGGVSFGKGITATEKMVFENAPSRARRVVKHGDTIVSTVRTYLRAISPINSPPGNLVVSTGFAVVRPRKIEPGFLAYAMQELSFVESVVARSVGVSYPAVNASDIGDISIPQPKPDEQRAIADFLDAQTAKLDALMDKKRALIEKLKEKRSALISRAVTRGLDPDAPMRPSGIDWLESIPRKWTAAKIWIHRVSRNIELQDGNHGELHPKSEDYRSTGIPFVMANYLDRGHIDFDRCNFIEKEQADSLRIGFAKEGDVLLTHKGTVGRVGVVQKSEFPYVMLTPQVTYYRCLKVVLNRFLRWQFEGQFWLDQLKLTGGQGSTRAYVGLLDQKTLHVLMPPMAEQIEIANYLDKETVKFDQMIDAVERVLDKLDEYRSALITAAVTGKLDVRKTAA